MVCLYKSKSEASTFRSYGYVGKNNPRPLQKPKNSSKFPYKEFQRSFFMSSFFHQQTQIMMGKHIDSYPLLKINRLLDWQPV